MSKFARWKVLLGALLAISVLAAGCGGGSSSEGSGSSGGSDVEAATSLSGAGASFPAPVYEQMFQAYNQDEGVQVNYNPVGSGGGRDQFIDKTVDFAGSDAPMSDDEMQQAGGDPQHVATVGGAAVLAYNLPELEGEDPINLTGPVVADIFLGNVTKWNDPAIAKLNPDFDLPDADITVVHRSDGSGTTDIFSSYLDSISKDWADQVGAGDELDWPVGVGGEGNDGVTAQISQTQNSIGYIGLEYAKGEADLPFANLSNSPDDPFVTPSVETAENAIAAVQDQIPDDLRLVLSSKTAAAKGDDIYPITSITWLLLRAQQDDLAKCKGVAQMAWYMTHDGQQFAPKQNYVELPDGLVKADEQKIKSLKAEGQQCYTG